MKARILLLTVIILALALFAPAAALADDEPSSWAADEVGRAVALGLVRDSLRGDYQADITREDFCRLIMTLVYLQDGDAMIGVDLPDNPFGDTDDGDVLAAYALGIVTGKAESVFDPKGAILRQEAAAMLTRAARVLGMDTSAGASYFADAGEISGYAVESVDFVRASGVMRGTGGAMFSPNGFYTREQSYMTALRLHNVLNGIENEQTPITSLAVRRVDSSAYGEPFAIVDGFVYFIRGGGDAYRAPIGSPEKAELLYRGYEGDGFSSISTSVFEGAVIINERIGGATMGESRSKVILPDGSGEMFGFHVSAYASVDGYDVVFGRGSGGGPPWPRFEARAKGGGEFRSLGEEGYMYGVIKIVAEDLVSISHIPDFAVIGGDIYVIAQHLRGEDGPGPPGIYKVDARTGKTERAVEDAAISFMASGDSIYFIGADNLLYKALTGDGEAQVQRVSDVKMSDFFVLGDEIYYTAYSPQVTAGTGEDAPTVEIKFVLYNLSGEEVIPFNVIHNVGRPNEEGYFVARAFSPDADAYQWFVIDKAGNVYTSSLPGNIKFTTVFSGVIWEFV